MPFEAICYAHVTSIPSPYSLEEVQVHSLISVTVPKGEYIGINHLSWDHENKTLMIGGCVNFSCVYDAQE